MKNKILQKSLKKIRKKKNKLSKVVKAKIADAVDIRDIINIYAEEHQLLSRSLINIYENLRDFWIIKDDNEKLIGCSALHIVWEDMAELRSLVVTPEQKGKGFGGELVKQCIEEAKELGLKQIFTLTYIPAFFEHFGFEVVDKDTLPHKIWSDCINCVKFPNCNETALILRI